MKKENVTGTYTDEYHITSRKVDGSSQKPIYKLISGDEYIYYLPDEFGWRIGDIIGNDFGYFSYESMNLIIDYILLYALIYYIYCLGHLHTFEPWIKQVKWGNTVNTSKLTCTSRQHNENYCNNTPCENNGTCYNGLSNYRCDCECGWTGSECNRSKPRYISILKN